LITLRLGGLLEARRYFEQAILISREIREWGGEAGSLSNIGWIHYQQGDLESALQYQKQGLRVAQEHNVALIESYIQLRLGRIYAESGQTVEAIEAYQRSLDLRRQQKRLDLAIEPLAGLAGAWLAQGDSLKASDFAAEVLTLLERPGILIAEDPDDPCWISLSVYQVLRANHDPLAREILVTAARLLEKILSFLPTEEQRRAFLEARPSQQAVLDELKKGEREPLS
jgi:tetratricopeptide (TPR) repeat protein